VPCCLAEVVWQAFLGSAHHTSANLVYFGVFVQFYSHKCVLQVTW
jgi:hypothetical protein